MTLKIVALSKDTQKAPRNQQLLVSLHTDRKPCGEQDLASVLLSPTAAEEADPKEVKIFPLSHAF